MSADDAFGSRPDGFGEALAPYQPANPRPSALPRWFEGAPRARDTGHRP